MIVKYGDECNYSILYYDPELYTLRSIEVDIDTDPNTDSELPITYDKFTFLYTAIVKFIAANQDQYYQLKSKSLDWIFETKKTYEPKINLKYQQITLIEKINCKYMKVHQQTKQCFIELQFIIKKASEMVSITQTLRSKIMK